MIYHPHASPSVMSRWSFALLLALAPGCSSSGTTPLADAAAGNDAPSIGGGCSFVLVDGAARTPVSGVVRARMNGSGNLLVVCELSASPFATGAALELHIGNATFDGPRIYRMDDFRPDGFVDFATGASGVSYSSNDAGGGCTVDLTTAGPLDARGDSVRMGGSVAGTFTCTGLIGDPTDMPPSFSVEGGTFAGLIE